MRAVGVVCLMLMCSGCATTMPGPGASTNQLSDLAAQVRQLQERVSALELGRNSGETDGQAPSAAGAASRMQDQPTSAEKAYKEAYQLWAHDRCNKAEPQLKSFLNKYPLGKLASSARELLGRCYLKGGNATLAAITLYANFKSAPQGDRAPDSLLYLGQAMMQLKRPNDACKVYAQLVRSYASVSRNRLQAELSSAKAKARCRAAG